MATYSRDDLECQRGPTRVLRTSENDQPYSASWVSHKLEGFVGKVSNRQLDQVECPHCKQIGKVKYALKGSKGEDRLSSEIGNAVYVERIPTARLTDKLMSGSDIIAMMDAETHSKKWRPYKNRA